MADKASGKRTSKGLSQGAMWALVAVALVGGLLIGRFALAGIGVGGGGSAIVTQGSAGSADLTGATAITEGQLDDMIGTYTYDGHAYDVTIREVIEMTSTLEAAASDDGTYQLPSADTLLTYARNQLILRAAEDAGITMTDEELAAYTLEQYGSDDFALLASQYGIDEELLKKTITTYAISEKLIEAKGISIPTAPTPPVEPLEGEEETPTAEYAQYIINLAGDAWDSAAQAWVDPDGAYAAALASYEITNDSATYEAATAAYYVAYQTYSTEAQDVSTLLSAYYNEIFSHGTLTMNTLTQ